MTANHIWKNKEHLLSQRLTNNPNLNRLCFLRTRTSCQIDLDISVKALWIVILCDPLTMLTMYICHRPTVSCNDNVNVTSIWFTALIKDVWHVEPCWSCESIRIHVELEVNTDIRQVCGQTWIILYTDRTTIPNRCSANLFGGWLTTLDTFICRNFYIT